VLHCPWRHGGVSGRRIAESSCAACHAVHSYDTASPEPGAPRFEVIADDPAASVAGLTGWLRASHPAMPNVMLDEQQARDVVAYLMSLGSW
jgi:mono/diheme cytochrome c family protein